MYNMHRVFAQRNRGARAAHIDDPGPVLAPEVGISTPSQDRTYMIRRTAVWSVPT